MKKLGIAAALVMAAGCATTDVTSSWKDTQREVPRPQKVLVVGVIPSETVRRNLEQDLSTEFQKQGVNAVPSARYFEKQQQLTADSVRDVAEREGFDAVLVSAFRGIDTKVEYAPGWGYSGWWGWGGGWGWGWGPGWYSPGYYYPEREALLETTLFEEDGNGGKMVWSATSETELDGNLADKTHGIAEKVVERMKKDALL